MAAMLADLGAEVDGIGTFTLRVRCATVTKDEPAAALVGRLRGSVLLLGPLLARRGRVCLAAPGGDFPTRRTLSTHVQALTAMGARLLDGPGPIFEAPNGLRPTSIYLEEASVTGTETALLAAVHTAAYNHTIGTQKSAKVTIANPWEDFHVYAMEWYADRIDIFVGG